MIRYTEDHEWLEQDGEEIVVGITQHAAEQLGDLVFIELPEDGREVAAGDEIVVIESVKAASDIAAPIAGTVTAVNPEIVETPSLVSDDPRAAWFFRIKPAEPGALDAFMSEEDYTAMVG